MTDPDVKDLLQRVAGLEHDFHNYLLTAGIVIAVILVALGVSLDQLFRWAKKRAKKNINEAIKQSQFSTAEEAAKKYLASVGEAAAAIETEKTKTISAGILARSQIAEVNPPADNTPGLVVQLGENKISLAGENYRRAKITFASKFAKTPMIFVGEAEAGEWIFVKVDSKSPEGFVWAARTLSGVKWTRDTTIQWAAVGIALQGGKEPAAAKFELEA